MAVATSAGSVLVQVGTDMKGFDSGMGSVEKRLHSFGPTVSRAMKVGVGAFVAGGALALNAAGNFEQSLNVLQAVSGATGGQMKQFSNLAKDLGADLTLPATSAKDAADAMLELSKGGLSVKDTMAAAKGVLQLSAAAQIDNATAATITARALNAFNLQGSEATRVADVLANAANASTGEITDFALGLQQSSAVASQWGLSLNETTAALMEMADAGVVGSDAGTSLKTMLQALSATSKPAAKQMKAMGIDVFDANGKFVGMRATIQQFSRSLKGMTQEQQTAALKIIFGSDAVRAANIILGKGAKAYDEYVTKTEQSGTAAETAAARMKGFKGALAGLQSQLETMAINIGEKLIPTATSIVSRLNTLFSDIGSATTFKAKLNVLWDFGTGIADALQTALVGGMVVATSSGTPALVWRDGLQQMIQKATEGVDWAQVGKTMLDGITSGFKASVARIDELFTMISDAVIRNRGKLAEAGATIVVSIFTTLLDPAFWAKHWDLAIAVAVAVFGRGIGKIAGKLLSPLTKLGGDMVLGILGGIERFSPRIASALLAGLTRLPSLASGALGRLSSVVSSVFGRLGKIAVFAVRVLGIQTAVNAVASFATAAWKKLKELLDKVGKFAGDMYNAGLDVGRNLLKGIGMGIVGALPYALSKLGEAIGSLKKRAEFWKSPPDAYGRWIGALVVGGIGDGMGAGTPGAVAAAGRMVGAIKTQIGKLNAEITAINERRAAEDRAQAVRDTAAALAEARKKGEGVAAAVRAHQRALEDIEVAGQQSRLDKLTRAQERAEQAQQKHLDKLQKAAAKAQERLGAIYDKLAGQITSAFDKATAAYKGPAQQELDLIRSRRQTEDLNQAVTDAEKRLNEARTGGDPGQIAEAERALARAREDITIASLETQAAAEQTAWEEQRADLRTRLDERLQIIREKLSTENGGWDKAMGEISKLLNSWNPKFGDAGAAAAAAYANAFKAGLPKYLGSEAARILAGGTAAKTAPTVTHTGVQPFATGGIVTRPTLGLVGEAGTEAVIPIRQYNDMLTAPLMRSRGGGNTTITNTVVFPNYGGDKREITRMVLDELRAIGGRNS